jgi:hypothetical protein
MHPLTVQILTKDRLRQKEVQLQYVVETKHPRWELFKIFWNAFITLRFR